MVPGDSRPAFPKRLDIDKKFVFNGIYSLWLLFKDGEGGKWVKVNEGNMLFLVITTVTF